ncbi:hypothetical protein PHYBLDRAFT_68377 [Phycomyces blakesleeanus NRRL 1555(-)]|uniref:Uncharacterized protein n=1 Tax=Phycomyces blakesleeanus (strain ATCC 8743b / DSM 1359 / FGSC 10004 / NBRC 33097 / NRRL 1555) TaxID=763407 RepID=A0A162W7B5_PHYB8|nr:hypothetical protein PHYBLDRAFT_176420 [Phycomyces blakesleeanus NRRL 1555(-)]XP_018288568.1 hypothetical protein PHYBLDRAFT_68377 [Phycomyces blakesleeanus NRRL 1555(-)]OAD65125.1 hypothetical protein PHYBLDRAFT_176420 [Phycomyces blakesleeanus NRRL 1555(-)]OAD70528.1 hypothetical protein PHYBLDRAFT_68377 [Phycomyces blakesleeanus NRRL 1555(-)]|eukprot:XP_018283165.1 hypothetical protein PHYBLDRAFT_176420 [Phycomyces blakesleeanus NRRL 1555(-)]
MAMGANSVGNGCKFNFYGNQSDVNRQSTYTVCLKNYNNIIFVDVSYQQPIEINSISSDVEIIQEAAISIFKQLVNKIPSLDCCLNEKTIISLRIASLKKLLDFVTNHNISDCQATNFHKNIRAFKSAFAFASIKTDMDERLASKTDDVFTFHINNIIYHNIVAFQSQYSRAAGFSQIYFCNTNKRLTRRTTLF